MKSTRRLTFIALLVAQALVLHIIERMIPVPFISPGARLGLANIVTLLSLYVLGFRDTLLVVVLRVFLGTLLGGSLSSFLYSFSGGIISFLFMYITMQLGEERVSEIGISIVGAVFHNIGQIIVAAIIVNNIRIAAYLPILMVAGLGTGVFIGITVKYLKGYVKKIVSYGVH